MIFMLERKRILTTLTALLVILAIFVFGLNAKVENVFSTANANDWGLSYPKNGDVPTGNADSNFLREFNSYYVADTSDKIIYLTFDAGYENGNTEKILSALKKHNVSATFFLVDNFIKTSPDIVKKIVSEGHIVGNHTTTHPDMSKISDKSAFEAELKGLENSYKELIGTDMLKIYRPPQGKFSEDNLKAANEMGYKTFFWSLAYVDWLENKQPTKEEAFSKLLTRIHPGAIVLLHSTSSTNAEILDELLTKWESMGYSFGKLTDIK